jgi:putative nucleotidyltransferase with HDIG domain
MRRKKILAFRLRWKRSAKNGLLREPPKARKVSLRRIGMLLLLGSTVAVLFPTKAIGASLLVILLLSFLFAFATGNIRKFSPNDRDLLLLTLLLVILMIATKGSLALFPVIGQALPEIPTIAYLYGIGVPAGAMLVRIVLNSETALVFSLLSSAYGGWLMENSFFFTLYFFLGSIVGAHSVGFAEDRAILIRAGAKVGIVNGLMILCESLIRHEWIWTQLGFKVFFGFFGGVFAGIFVLGVLPIVEWIFGYTTNSKLLELANLNHPLLKRMILEAPGTYHHSIVVSTLAETAAREVNAHPLLARVSAYYHDIGKIDKPLYFIENQGNRENRHEKLAPSMSSLILISHVKEGLELARQYGLGEKISQIIQQHHGTSLISYFYQKAKEKEDPAFDPVVEANFRYPGPKPQTKEAALVLLADAAEAASRTLQDPTPARLQGMVQKIINQNFADGQLDECELTLKDLHRIARSFSFILAGIYHQRIEYPIPATKEGPARKKNHQNADLDKQPTKSNRSRSGEDPKNSEEDLKRLGMWGR